MKTLNDFDFKIKKQLSVDFNVPLDENFNVTDATRIEAAKPTIDAILKQGGSVILMSHLGRPKGVDAQFSLKHILNTTADVLGVPVQFASNCIGAEAKEAADKLQAAGVLENLRFHSEEEAGDVAFAKELASLGDIYVNDALVPHTELTLQQLLLHNFPTAKCFGLLLAKEIESLNKVLKTVKTSNCCFGWL
jgi:phosphoglycerate kinase